MLATALSLCVAALLMGPVLVRWGRGRAAVESAIDGATLGLLLAVVLLRVLPHLSSEIGLEALAGAAAGYGLFALLEGASHRRAGQIAILVVMPSLALHAFMDGAALAIALDSQDAVDARLLLAAALITHKVPEGLFVASAIDFSQSVRAAFGRVSLLALATVVGACTGRELLTHARDDVLHLAVAVGIGVVIRLAVHQHRRVSSDRSTNLASGVAFLIAVLVVVAIPAPRVVLGLASARELSALESLTPFLIETAPGVAIALVVGALIRRARVSNTTAASWSLLIAEVAVSFTLLGAKFALVVGTLRIALKAASRASARVRVADPSSSATLAQYAFGIVAAVTIETTVPIQTFPSTAWVVMILVAAAALTKLPPLTSVFVATCVLHKGGGEAGALAVIAGSAVAASFVDTSWARYGVALLLAFVATYVFSTRAMIFSPDLHSIGRHAHDWYEWISACVICGWVLREIASSGPRSWFARAWPTRVDALQPITP
jgi:hypothetical protein